MNARSFVFALTCLCFAACTPKDPITIGSAWIRAPAPGLGVAAGYLDIVNSSAAPIALTGATSPAADSVEIHTESHDGDMMQMRRIDALTIPSGQTVSLAPGGTHLMLLKFTGTAAPIRVTLMFDDGSRRDVEFDLRALDGGPP
jgi:copper(I)-binding protein